MQTNPKLELARKYVEQTKSNIFLTGRAGTGKTTFLKSIVRDMKHKRFVVLAPTGIAALNAEGQTIHSFLQLELTPYIPGGRLPAKKFRKDKLNLIRSLDLIIIDEISMVRADLLDQIDRVLRKLRYRHAHQAFGGVQMLLIGDLSQLPPVATGQDWDILSQYYDTPYFFSAQIWQDTAFHTIELDHIYRQKDLRFINLLNRVRDNDINTEVIETLNSRYNPELLNQDSEGCIILCTHNHKANEINRQHLDKLNAKSYFYHCKTTGEFDERNYPNAEILELKEGAQVMFIKNDYSNAEYRRYYNGTLGTITYLDEQMIKVKVSDGGEEIEIERYVWERCNYKLDKANNEIIKEVVGTFEQYPIRLAWAITIHKSQGLTFEKAIIDASQSFTHGQYYVALSRCKSLEGMSLTAPFLARTVITDPQIDSFSHSQTENQANELTFEHDRQLYSLQTLEEVYSFATLQELKKQVFEHIGIYFQKSDSFEAINMVNSAIEENIISVSERFIRQLRILADKSEQLKERCAKADVYFLEQIRLCFTLLQAIDTLEDFEPDSQTEEILMRFGNEVELKCRLLTYLQENEYRVEEVQTLKNKIISQGDKTEWTHFKSYIKAMNPDTSESRKDSMEIELDDLYQALKNWRKEKAVSEHLPAYCILGNKALEQIAVNRPLTSEQLQGLKGIGKKTMEKYSDDILELVERYA